MKIFKSEDFREIFTLFSTYQIGDMLTAIETIANKKHQEWLEQQPAVYGNMYINNENTGIDVGSVWSISKFNGHGHRARLVCIEPIVQEQHECVPAEVIVQVGQYTKSVTFDYSSNSICKICGAELKAKWEKVK